MLMNFTGLLGVMSDTLASLLLNTICEVGEKINYRVC
jgi:hypothetical protein